MPRYQPRHTFTVINWSIQPRHSFTAIEAVNHSLLRIISWWLSVNLWFQRKCRFSFWFHLFPEIFGFLKGGGLWKSVKIRKLTKSKPEVLIYSVQGSQPWPFRAWGTHIRLLKNSRLLDLGPAAQSYSLKEKYMLISFTVRSHVIFA